MCYWRGVHTQTPTEARGAPPMGSPFAQVCKVDLCASESRDGRLVPSALGASRAVYFLHPF